jgi:hypothetical protein
MIGFNDLFCVVFLLGYHGTKKTSNILVVLDLKKKIRLFVKNKKIREPKIKVK